MAKAVLDRTSFIGCETTRYHHRREQWQSAGRQSKPSRGREESYAEQVAEDADDEMHDAGGVFQCRWRLLISAVLHAFLDLCVFRHDTSAAISALRSGLSHLHTLHITDSSLR